MRRVGSSEPSALRQSRGDRVEDAGGSPMAVIVGVTGSIASGKSSLCRYLVERHGAVHADGDAIIHRMYDPGTPGFDRVVEAFGEAVIGADGFVDRKVLGGLVFGDRERTAALKTAIGDVASEVRRLIDRWRAELPPGQLAALEVFSLVENGYAALCDATWLVATDDSVALSRLMSRNELTLPEAEVRVRSGRAWQIRADACDRVIFNTGSLGAFEAAIDAEVRDLLAQHRAPSEG